MEVLSLTDDKAETGAAYANKCASQYSHTDYADALHDLAIAKCKGDDFFVTKPSLERLNRIP